jgi:DNA-binding transcriptional MocR family regulator
LNSVTRTVRSSKSRASAPLYRRLFDELAGLIDGHALRPGDRLPSVRLYARQKRVSLATVLRTYQLLEDRGYLEVRPQSGHFVSASRLPLAPRPTPGRVSRGREDLRVADMIGELLDHVSDPGLAPFGIATVAPEHYPARRLGRILARIAREVGSGGLAYGPARGHEALRHELLRRALAAGLTLTPAELVITNGCTEAINLALRALTTAGDTILIESPTSYGFLEAAESLGLRVAEVPTDPEWGVPPEHLEAAIRRVRPRAFLTIPNFQNPLGFTVPDDSKRELVAVAKRHQLPIIEDDIHSELHFGAVRPTSLKSFDDSGNVLLCSSFSKTLAPGYRVGWVAAGRHADRILKLKLASSLHTNTLAQLAIAEFTRHGGAEHQFRHLRELLRVQVADYSRAVGRHFPPGTRVSRPLGGHLLWIELARETDAMELSRRALARGIGITPGHLFAASSTYAHCFRLNCGYPLTPTLEAALQTLAELAKSLEVGRVARSQRPVIPGQF